MPGTNENRRIEELARKWRDGSISEAEKAEFDQWYNSFNDAEYEAASPEAWLMLKERMYQAIVERENVASTAKAVKLWKRLPVRMVGIAAAACLLLFISITYFMSHRTSSADDIQAQLQKIGPGANKATLTLSNGSSLQLTDSVKGLIAQQGQTGVVKNASGQILYQSAGSKIMTGGAVIAGDTVLSEEIAYNTLATPRGGSYAVTLADGTHVLLDAASSIRYPVKFSGKERLVEITGQAYFEVKHDSRHPFRVKVRGITIEDIGTEFNINAYSDEPVISTTLIEGSVSVANAGTPKPIVLQPGQQAIGNDNGVLNVKNADIEEVVSWKNGQTLFKSQDINTIMRQVSRWYDVDVSYEGQLPKMLFSGGMSRTANLAELMKILEFNNVHFTLDQRHLIIRP